MQKIPKVSLDILVSKQNKFLFGQLSPRWSRSDKKMYGFPGREVNFGEKIADAVKRNIKEEIGCKLKNFKILGVSENFYLGNHYIGIVISAKVQGEVKNMRPEDWTRWEWFPIEDFPSNLFPSAKEAVKLLKK